MRGFRHRCGGLVALASRLLLASCAAKGPAPMPADFPSHTSAPPVEIHYRLTTGPDAVRADGLVERKKHIGSAWLQLLGLDAAGTIVSFTTPTRVHWRSASDLESFAIGSGRAGGRSGTRSACTPSSTPRRTRHELHRRSAPAPPEASRRARVRSSGPMGARMKLGSFSRYPFLFGPSPVHPLERLSAHLGGARVWAKRDDCNSGLAFGGNKIRKLEYLVAEAIAKGCDTLVSIGGVQSNHTRQVAAAAARVGMRCVLVQESWVDWPDAVYDRVGNILLSRIDGRGRPAGAGGVRDRVQGELGAGDPGHRGRRRHGRTPSRPARRTTGWVVSASRSGRRRSSSRSGSSASSSTR